MGEPEGQGEKEGQNALQDALTHLVSAAQCIDSVTSAEGHLDLVAQTHIASATALVEVLRNHEEIRKARAAAAR